MTDTLDAMPGVPMKTWLAGLTAGDYELANSTLAALLGAAEPDRSVAAPLTGALVRNIPYVNTIRKSALATVIADRLPWFMQAFERLSSDARLRAELDLFSLLVFLRRIDKARSVLDAVRPRLGAAAAGALDYLTDANLLLRDFPETVFAIETRDDLPVVGDAALAEPPAEDCRVRLRAAGPDTVMVPPSHVIDPYGAMDRGFRFDLPLAAPELNMLCLRGATTVAAGAILTRRRTVLFESVYREQVRPPSPFFLHRKSVVKAGGEAGTARFAYNTHASLKVITEPCVMLATERKFFATWMIHQFPRLYCAERIGVKGLKYVINKDINANCFEMLAAIGISRDDVVELDPGSLHVFDTLYVPTSPAFEWEWCIPEARAVFDRLRPPLRGRTKGPTMIYISRRDTTRKKAENDEAVARVLERRGFTVVVPGELSFVDKAACFADARVIAGAVGSGQFNALLAPPGCHLVHLGNPLAAPLTTASLARFVNGKASYVFGRFLEPMPPVVDRLTHATFASANFEVDLGTLDEFAAALVSTFPRN